MTGLPIDAEGRFAGYASRFGQLDEGGDMVMPGAFAQSLAQRGATGIRMLFQHDPKEPVGLWDVIAEDGAGLWVEGRLVPGVPRAEALRALIARGALDGLSIGFRTLRASREPRGGTRKLWQIDLWEVSIVTFPMLASARIAAGGASRLDGRLGAAISLLRQKGSK